MPVHRQYQVPCTGKGAARGNRQLKIGQIPAQDTAHRLNQFLRSAGAFRLNFRRFMLASLVGRGGRFFLVGILITIFGAQVEHAIDEYFDILAIAFVVLLVLGFIVIRFVMRPRATAADASTD